MVYADVLLHVVEMGNGTVYQARSGFVAMIGAGRDRPSIVAMDRHLEWGLKVKLARA